MNTFQTPPPPGASPAAAGKGSKKTTKKMARTQVIAAVVLAGVAAAIIYLTLSKSGDDGVWVLTSNTSLSTRDAVDPANFVPKLVAIEDVAEGAYQAPSAEGVVAAAELTDDNGKPRSGLVIQYPVAKGSQLVRNMISAEKILEAPLQPNERLMSIQANPGAAVAGGIRVGDRVDFYGVFAGGAEQDAGGIANLIAPNVEIVGVSLGEAGLQGAQAAQAAAAAAGGEVKDKEQLLPATPIPQLYTVRVPAALAARLALASENTTVYVFLRGKDATDDATQPITLSELMCAETVTGEALPTGPASATCNEFFTTNAQG